MKRRILTSVMLSIGLSAQTGLALLIPISSCLFDYQYTLERAHSEPSDAAKLLPLTRAYHRDRNQRIDEEQDINRRYYPREPYVYREKNEFTIPTLLTLGVDICLLPLTLPWRGARELYKKAQRCAYTPVDALLTEMHLYRRSELESPELLTTLADNLSVQVDEVYRTLLKMDEEKWYCRSDLKTWSQVTQELETRITRKRSLGLWM